MGMSKLTPATTVRQSLTAYSEALTQQAGVSGAVNLDLAQTNDFVVVAGAGNVALAFANPPPPGAAVPIRIKLVQDAGGGRQFTFPSSVIWPLNLTPQLPTAPNAQVVVQLVTFDGGATYNAQIQSGDAGGKLWPIAGLFGAGADYVPQWTADAHNPILGNGTITGRHFDIGKLCVCSVVLTIGSTTILRGDAGIWRFTLPHNVAGTWLGEARYIRPPSPNAIAGQVLPSGGNVFALNFANANAPDMDAAANNAAGGQIIDGGDAFELQIAYEQA